MWRAGLEFALQGLSCEKPIAPPRQYAPRPYGRHAEEKEISPPEYGKNLCQQFRAAAC